MTTEPTGFQWRLVAPIAVIVAAMLLGVGALLGAALQPDEWAPLGPYPEQNVVADATVETDYGVITDTGTTNTIEAVDLGDDVEVHATKCAEETVTVTGVVTWRSLQPRGFAVETGRGTGPRQEGCEDAEFSNPVPDEVIAWAEKQFADGADHVVVQIGGCETPTEVGRDGETLCWHTEPFALVP